jgi:hypothetical protein
VTFDGASYIALAVNHGVQPSVVATTGSVSVAGIYNVNAAALVTPDVGDGIICYLSTGTGGNVNNGINGGFTNFSSGSLQTEQASVSESLSVAVGDVINFNARRWSCVPLRTSGATQAS